MTISSRCNGQNLINHINQLSNNKQININIKMEYIQVKEFENLVDLEKIIRKNNILNIETYCDVKKNNNNINKSLWLCKLKMNDKYYYSISSTKNKGYKDILSYYYDDLLSYL